MHNIDALPRRVINVIIFIMTMYAMLVFFVAVRSFNHIKLGEVDYSVLVVGCFGLATLSSMIVRYIPNWTMKGIGFILTPSLFGLGMSQWYGKLSEQVVFDGLLLSFALCGFVVFVATRLPVIFNNESKGLVVFLVIFLAAFIGDYFFETAFSKGVMLIILLAALVYSFGCQWVGGRKIQGTVSEILTQSQSFAIGSWAITLSVVKVMSE